MRVFLYEFVTGGGTRLSEQNAPTDGLLAEGLAMRDALAQDLARRAETTVSLLVDEQLATPPRPNCDALPVSDVKTHWTAFDQQVRSSDVTWIIAPEIQGWLSRLCARVERLGGTCIGPDQTFLRLASDKLATIERLRKSNVPVPTTRGFRDWDDWNSDATNPVVIKPKDGAGGWMTQRIAPFTSVDLAGGIEWCVQTYVPGRAASIAAICDHRGPTWLPPMWQRVSPLDFAYRGGERIESSALVRRVRTLGHAALAALPKTKGYLGVDVVLGMSASGANDVVLEVNPRLTTSYVGLRRLSQQNLASAILEAVTRRSPELSFVDGPLQFEADGTVTDGVVRGMDIRHSE